jgi:hypothetical protein
MIGVCAVRVQNIVLYGHQKGTTLGLLVVHGANEEVERFLVCKKYSSDVLLSTVQGDKFFWNDGSWTGERSTLYATQRKAWGAD